LDRQVLKIKIITVGRISKVFAREALSEYTRLISNFFKIEVVSIKEKSFFETSARLKKEEEEVLKLISDNCFLVVLDEKGKSLNTEEFASFLDTASLLSKEIVFVVGSDVGVSNELKNRANLVLSLSSLTLAHQIALIVLLEQIYRAATILKGHPYHRS
jgi:23S rRNA (pseudouridine1915-N3)-methyltransferase